MNLPKVADRASSMRSRLQRQTLFRQVIITNKAKILKHALGKQFERFVDFGQFVGKIPQVGVVSIKRLSFGR